MRADKVTPKRASSARTVVNAWNDWDRLLHVIVGRADGTRVQAPEPAVFRDWPEHGFPKGTYGALPSDVKDAANAELDYLAKVLEQRGIRVDRPTPLDFGETVATPDWSQASMFGCGAPRDVLVTIGNEVLESTMSYRSRWFEYLCYRPLLEAYFIEDSAMRWEAAPKPRLTRESYVPEFWERFEELEEAEQLQHVRTGNLVLTDTEPLFDAADIARIGRDLFVQLSLATNRKGVDWLARHFVNHRVHAVTFDNTHPLHIDATWVPLRPGLVLHCGERPAEVDLVEYFTCNDWEVVRAPAPSRRRADLPPLCFCSPWLSMNLLSIDSQTVCVEAGESALADLLTRRGFEVIPIPFWNVAPVGGGLHCATVDIQRVGAMEDYFPKRWGRF